jgi:hypothetical protein
MILTAKVLLLGYRYHSKSNRPTIPRKAGRRYDLAYPQRHYDGGLGRGTNGDEGEHEGRNPLTPRSKGCVPQE